MARRPPLPTPAALRRRREHRTQRILANRAVADALVSVAALVGRPVLDQRGLEVGRLLDLVVRWHGEPYPPVTGLVLRVARRRAYVPIDQVEDIAPDRVTLRSARLNLRDFERREGEVVLNGDVVDHQLVDVDGVRVVRASDLYLARVAGVFRLVGVDVSFHSLLRRLGPTRWRVRATPERVIDWGAIQSFGSSDATRRGPMRLHAPNQALRRLRPSELADLLEELGREERQELLAQLDSEIAADALEEMDPEELGALLRESEPDRAAALLAEMEPDEAADALRDLEPDEAAELLAVMPPERAASLRALVLYREGTAGGLMTTNLILVHPHQTVGEVRRILRTQAEHQADVDAVIIVDEHGAVVHDLGLFELLVAASDDLVIDVAVPPTPEAVNPDATLDDVIEQFIDSRGSSLLVVD
ncbi:MAG: magnesium transporter MgtE N-terminal domain-containing protein, partial [Acidimicrobiia bacterium]